MKTIFIKHKNFKDVCIELYTVLDVVQADNAQLKIVRIYGDYWNMGVNRSFRIGSKGSRALHDLTYDSFLRDWEMACYLSPKEELPCLRDINWNKMDINILKG